MKQLLLVAFYFSFLVAAFLGSHHHHFRFLHWLIVKRQFSLPFSLPPWLLSLVVLLLALTLLALTLVFPPSALPTYL